MYKAVIFDLDGTLADTLSSIAYFGNLALRNFGYNEIPKDEYRFLAGKGAKNLVKSMLNFVGENNSNMFEKVYNLYNKEYDDNYMYLTSSFDGINEMLDKLKEKNIKLGVLSNKPHETTIKVVNELFGNRIDLCYGKRENTPRKPDPTALFDMLNKWNINSNECIYVGDTSTDMQTGKNANTYTIGVTWGFRDRQELIDNNADLVIDNPNELVEFIKRNN